MSKVKLLATLATSALMLFVSPDLKCADGLRRYTIEDQLRLETTGRSVTSPDGRLMVWEQAPPYLELPDYSIDGGGFRLMAVDLSDPQIKARRLLPTEDGRLYWIDRFSPDGRFLAFYSSHQGHFSIGVYDFLNTKVRYFQPAPRVSSRGVQLAWVSNDRFVYAAYDRDRQPSYHGARRYTGERLMKEWANAWRGNVHSASVINTVGQPDPVLAGGLIEVNASLGESKRLGDGFFESLAISRDRRYVAAVVRDEAAQANAEHSAVGECGYSSKLWVRDLSTGKVLLPAKGMSVVPDTLAWSPTADSLAFFSRDACTPAVPGLYFVYQLEADRMVQYPHAGFELVYETERRLAPSSVLGPKPERAFWVSDRLAVLARASGDVDQNWVLIGPDRAVRLTKQLGEGGVPVYTSPESLAVMTKGDVWVLTAESEVNLTELPSGTEISMAASNYLRIRNIGSPNATFIVQNGSNIRLLLMDIVNGSRAAVEFPRNDAKLLGSSVQFGAAMFRYETEDGTDLVLRFTDGGELALGRLNAHLAGVERPKWHSFSYKVLTRSGEVEANGCFVLPSGFEAGKKYPLVVDIYPNVSPYCDDGAGWTFAGGASGSIKDAIHVLSSNGYVVYRPDTRFSRINDMPLGDLASIVTQGIDELGELKFIDEQRVGLFGFSQGGFASLVLGGKTERFGAIVSANGWSDAYSHYFEGTILQKFYADEYPYRGAAPRYENALGDFGLGTDPWSGSEKYIKNSPLFMSSRISSPVMLIHSDMDQFNLSQYELVFTSLHRQGKIARFLRYWGEGHMPSSPANIRHMWEQILSWYDTHLGVRRDLRKEEPVSAPGPRHRRPRVPHQQGPPVR